MRAFDYLVATTLAGARQAAAGGAHPKAGGVDLLDRLKERLPPHAERVVALHRLPEPELRAIAPREGGGFDVGALVTLRDLGAHAALRAALPALADAAGHAATPQVRAVATLGGNLFQRPRCWYFRSADFPCLKKGGATCFAVEGDATYHALFGGGPCHIVHPSNVAPALVALDARLVLTSAAGDRTAPADGFFPLPREVLDQESRLRPGELLARVEVPGGTAASGYVEIRHKQSFDWPLASCAAARRPDGWRVVLGAVAPIPWRSPEAEAALGGVAPAALTPALAERAADAAVARAEPLADAAWRVPLARAAVRRALLAAAGKEDP